MTHLRPSVELCSFSVLGSLILLDEETATTIFARLCGIGLRPGLEAIRAFQSNVQQDERWLEVLDRIDAETVRDNPEAVLSLLIDGFGLYELDAMDVILRLAILAEHAPSGVLN